MGLWETEYKREIQSLKNLEIESKCLTPGRISDERLNDLMSSMECLIRCLRFEAEHKTIGPATDTATKYMSQWREVARNNGESQTGRKFNVLVERIRSSLPSNAITRPLTPVVDGTGSFRVLVMETLHKLPLSVRKAVEGIHFVELSARDTQGFFCRKNLDVIAVSGDLSLSEKRRTLLHEISHCVQNDSLSRTERETNAENQANEWMKLF